MIYSAVQGQIKGLERRLEKDLCQGRMGMDSLGNIRLARKVSCVWTGSMYTEDFTGICIGDDFGLTGNYSDYKCEIRKYLINY